MKNITLDQALALGDGIYEGIPDLVYHAIPYFSASYARRLIINPAAAQIQLDESSNMVLGSAIHALKLEGRDALNARYAFLPADAPKKPTITQRNAAKPSLDTQNAIYYWDLFESQNAGKTILGTEDKEIVEGCCKAIDEHPCVIKRGMFKSGMNEVTIIYTDRETGIRCKSRLDNLEDGFINDLKSTADSSSVAFHRSIVKYGYHIQAGSYSIAAATLGHEVKGVRLCAVCTKAPYQVLVGEFSESFVSIGQMEFCRALNIEAECRQLGMYPNLELPLHLPSLYDVYNPDGTVKNDSDLYEIFDLPAWMK